MYCNQIVVPDGEFAFFSMPQLTITPEKAALILSDPEPEKAFVEWVQEAKPVMQFALAITDVSWLKEALGKHLTESKINEAKQLTFAQ